LTENFQSELKLGLQLVRQRELRVADYIYIYFKNNIHRKDFSDNDQEAQWCSSDYSLLGDLNTQIIITVESH
jgi:hypothetical protein